MSAIDPLRTLEFQLSCNNEAKVCPLGPTDASLGLLHPDGAGHGPPLERKGGTSRVPDVHPHRRAVLHGDLPRVRTALLVGNRCTPEMAERSVDWLKVQTRAGSGQKLVAIRAQLAASFLTSASHP